MHVELIKRKSCYHIETSQLICRAVQVTGVCMMANLAFNEFKSYLTTLDQCVECFAEHVQSCQ